jgi:hypothetical protein
MSLEATLSYILISYTICNNNLEGAQAYEVGRVLV